MERFVWIFSGRIYTDKSVNGKTEKKKTKFVWRRIHFNNINEKKKKMCNTPPICKKYLNKYEKTRPESLLYWNKMNCVCLRPVSIIIHQTIVQQRRKINCVLFFSKFFFPRISYGFFFFILLRIYYLFFKLLFYCRVETVTNIYV